MSERVRDPGGLAAPAAAPDAEHARARLHSQFMQAPVPVSLVTGPTFVFELANPLYERMVGRTGLVGRPFREVYAELPDDAPVFQMLRDVYATGEPFQAEEYLVPLAPWPGNPTGETYFNFTCQPMRDEQGRVFGIMTVAVDVTAQVRARAEIEVANRTKDEFLSMLGHELRNPIAPILTALELMRLRDDEAHRKERAVIERQVNHLIRLVDDLLDASRIINGKVPLKRERVEAAELIARAIELVSPLIEQRRHRLRLSVPPSGLTIDADPVRLAQVFSNLLINAAKYTEPGGELTVEASREEASVAIRVRDNGVGLSPEMKARLFELFTQGRQAIDRSQGGLGLGLSIARGLLALHGGTIEAHSEGAQRGSEFTVRLPVTTAPDVAAAPPSPAAPTRARKARILVVDDNEDAAELIVEILRAMGYTVEVALDGPEALRIAPEFQPQIALLDIGLPVMDGYDLARHLRALPGLAGLCLVALTGYSQESHRRRSQEAGFAEHLIKPIDLDQLCPLLDRLVSSPP